MSSVAERMREHMAKLDPILEGASTRDIEVYLVEIESMLEMGDAFLAEGVIRDDDPVYECLLEVAHKFSEELRRRAN